MKVYRICQGPVSKSPFLPDIEGCFRFAKVKHNSDFRMRVGKIQVSTSHNFTVSKEIAMFYKLKGYTVLRCANLDILCSKFKNGPPGKQSRHGMGR